MGNEESKSKRLDIINDESVIGNDVHIHNKVRSKSTPPLSSIHKGVANKDNHHHHHNHHSTPSTPNATDNITELHNTNTNQLSMSEDAEIMTDDESTYSINSSTNELPEPQQPSSTQVPPTQQQPQPTPNINNIKTKSQSLAEPGSSGSSAANGKSSSSSSSSTTTGSNGDYTNTSISNTLDKNNSELSVMLKSLQIIEKGRYSSFIKCVILGSNGVGKTSFMRRFSSGEFDPEETTTIGAIRTLHEIHYNTLSLSLEIWDTGGHPRLSGLLPFYLKNCNCIIVMFELGSIDSFYKAISTISKTKKMVPEGTFFLLVANKADLSTQRAVSDVKISMACSEAEIGCWCEISARTGYNIHEPFHMISRHIITMVNALKNNHQIEKLYTSTMMGGRKTSHTDVDSLSILTSRDMSLIKNNMYSCVERSFKPNANSDLPLMVVLKLDVLKIIIEETNGNIFNKFLSKRTIQFKESTSAAASSLSSSTSSLSVSTDQQPPPQPPQQPSPNSSQTSYDGSYSAGSSATGSGEFNQPNPPPSEYKGHFCLVIDKYHPKRMEIKRLTSPNSSPILSQPERYDMVFICEYRDHLVKTFKTICSANVPIIEGTKGGDRNDFLYTVKEYLRMNQKEIDPLIEYQITNTTSTQTSFDKLDLSKLLKDERQIMAISKALDWNGSITKLDLSFNQFDLLDAKVLIDLFNAISNSTSIIHLDLSNNNIGSSKHKNLLIEFIKPSLKLQTLILNSNDLCSTTNLISQSLSFNTELVTLGLSNNGLKNSNAQSISQMLQSNKTMEVLDLSNNSIEEEGALFLLKAMEVNTTLTKLHLQGNKGISSKTMTLLP
ncbi:ADP-ribosylation like factor [Cavenderia fasciculata]|uniref:ADP-ribosylation like factor n=1 Tax=Cavenderia fasciculata TaxID=261658 RepID=F4Q9G5_CACFS|nr:ADP-ribosylation like factor [Cavenderia fasciculata]EGG15334.1 ADP-ribosylation like factor [Cavenderia fasciculata]|eukprot:XP_004352054.1 ADP-ribosylation like factor [Cavenderia fasciculata]